MCLLLLKKYAMLQILWYNLKQNVRNATKNWILLMAIDERAGLFEDFPTKTSENYYFPMTL